MMTSKGLRESIRALVLIKHDNKRDKALSKIVWRHLWTTPCIDRKKNHWHKTKTKTNENGECAKYCELFLLACCLSFVIKPIFANDPKKMLLTSEVVKSEPKKVSNVLEDQSNLWHLRLEL